MFLHLGSVRSYVSDCVMCEAAYADFILLLFTLPNVEVDPTCAARE